MRLDQSALAHFQTGRTFLISDAVDTVIHHGRDLAVHGAERLLRRTPSTTASATASSASASSTCSNNSSGDTCEKPANTSAAIPIALGIIIPLLSATVVLIYLHRRNNKRQRSEDRRDAEKYKSMDFGMDINFNNGEKKGRKGPPNVRGNYRPDMHTRGLSLEAGSHPYMFPDADYTASLHSLTRTIDDVHNPYRQADAMSIRAPSPSIRGRDNDSLMTGMSIPRPGSANPDSAQSLLRHPQAPGKTLPPRGATPTRGFESASPLPTDIKAFESGFAPISHSSVPSLAPPQIDISRDADLEKEAKDHRGSNNYLGSFIHSREPSAEVESKSLSSPSKAESITSTLVNSPSATSPKILDVGKSPFAELDVPLPTSAITPNETEPIKPAMAISPPDVPSAVAAQVEPRAAEFHSTASVLERRTSRQPHSAPPEALAVDASQGDHRNSYMSETSNYDDYQFRDSTISVQNGAHTRGQSGAAPMQTLAEDYASEYYDYARASQYLGIDEATENRRVSVVHRPLPPDDPHETPESRANRIRSFYKEYFDKRDTTYQQPGLPTDYQQPAGSYYEDYSQEYANDVEWYDPEEEALRGAPRPYAQPMGRRAMTPPPRGPPRFRGGPPSGYGPPSSYGSRPGSSAHGRGPSNFSHGRSRVHSSASGYGMPPRAGSSMSGRGRAPHRKPQPPPSALTSLPTPSKLKDDLIFGSTIDFAPPVSIRDLQNGRRPDSPMGSSRPYSPSVRSFNPLASSYDELNAMPSPHMLGKDSAFTGLDFAPPRRFKDGNSDSMSDTASVRSGRSGISGVHAYNVRNGAYRVSKIPKELAGTKDEITASLRPKWDIGR